MSDQEVIQAADSLAEAVRKVLVGGTRDHLWNAMEAAFVDYKRVRSELTPEQEEAWEVWTEGR